jgi:hypothetical protein
VLGDTYKIAGYDGHGTSHCTTIEQLLNFVLNLDKSIHVAVSDINLVQCAVPIVPIYVVD